MKTLSDDIGIIELTSAVTLTNNIKLISLDYETVNENVQVTVSGFGKTNDVNSDISAVLRYTSLTTITNTECDKTFDSVPSGVICAKGATTESACSVSVLSTNSEISSNLNNFFRVIVEDL